jgi:hypothetical protein
VLTITASKFGKVLDIEAIDSYMKRPAGPMVTIEVGDIAKLAGYIKIPSMAEGTSTMDTIRQRILYSCLPNQCRKCCKFGHQARTCNISKNKTQEGPAHHNSHPNANPRRLPNSRPPHQNATRESKLGSPPKTSTNSQTTGSDKMCAETKNPTNRPSTPTQLTGIIKKHIESSTFDPRQWSSTIGDQKDQDMDEPPKSPSRSKNKIRAEAK